jgi:hypothetical protein
MEDKEKIKQYRVVTSLKREELDFLDELEKDLYFTHGIHVPRSKLIEEIIEAFKDKNTKEAIEQNLIDKLKNQKSQE